jgi:hypothetical protein
MMNQKFQPGEEMFEDVEGHSSHGNAAPAEGDQVDDHATGDKTTSDDVEGHAAR